MTFKVTDLAEVVKKLLFNSKEEHEKGYREFNKQVQIYLISS